MSGGGLIKALEGYRAIAVLAVLIFHLDRTLLPGGYLGVDFFLIISGFIITRRLRVESEVGPIDLKGFYVRRMKRLFPALFTTILVTVMAGAFILTPSDLEALCRSALFGLLSLANFHFWGVQGYFNPGADTQPLLHIWSLSLEEQFYLFWPPLLAVCAIKFRPALAILAGIISFLALVLFSRSLPDAAFFLLPFRIYEFMAGAALSLISVRVIKSGQAVFIMGAGFALLCVAFLFFGKDTSILLSGGMTVIGGSLLLIGVQSVPANAIFGNAVLVWIGQRSYALYLVHWPLIVLFIYAAGHPGPIGLVGLGCGSFVLAWLLKRIVEDPLRWRATRPALSIIFAGGLATALLATTLLWTGLKAGGANDLVALTTLDPTYSARIRDRSCMLHKTQKLEDMPDSCLAIDPTRNNLLLIGSSVAANLRPGLDTALPDWNILQATAAGCRPLPEPSDNPACEAVRQHVFGNLLRNETYDLVLFAGMNRGKDGRNFKLLLEYLADKDIDYVVIGQGPRFRVDPMKRIKAYGRLEGLDAHMRDVLRQPRDAAEFFSDGQYFSVVDAFCGSGQCQWRDGPRNFYHDTYHLSPAGSEHFGRAFAAWLDTREAPQ